MKNKWLYLVGCIIAPHVMFVLGVVFLSKKDLEHKTFGLKLCKWSSVVLIIGSLAYYIIFAPVVGFD
jgi:hypothetical protein